MRDRYAEAVAARRAELRGRERLLGPGLRAELRDALVLARAGAAAATAADLTDLRHQIDVRHDPALVVDAARAVEVRAYARWAAAAGEAVLRVALHRELPVQWPVAVEPPGRALPQPPPPVRVLDVVADAGAWRLAVLPVAVAPLTGPAGPAVLLPALGAGVLVLATVLGARRAALRRARMRSWSAELLVALQARIDAELGRRTAALAADVGPVLEAAAARRRADVRAELALLAPREVSGAPA
ncbi:hypothetical protein [Pseudonocardia sp.]|uniref:hypothetical protein n=1 Tax=Pseudonocardia sp. TaxID=60912 RepID=UPI0026229631|nr:hypothetical protein [Pseudonocardia sp.]